MSVLWRPLRQADLPAVIAIAAIVHPGLPEDRAVLAERQALAPEGALFLEIEAEPAGYVFSHPAKLGHPPALNSLLNTLPSDPDTFYIHDLALLPSARGRGAAAAVVERLIGVARAYPTMSLVAVNGSAPFWSRFGFVAENRPALAPKLSTYGPHTQFMVRPRDAA